MQKTKGVGSPKTGLVARQFDVVFLTVKGGKDSDDVNNGLAAKAWLDGLGCTTSHTLPKRPAYAQGGATPGTLVLELRGVTDRAPFRLWRLNGKDPEEVQRGTCLGSNYQDQDATYPFHTEMITLGKKFPELEIICLLRNGDPVIGQQTPELEEEEDQPTPPPPKVEVVTPASTKTPNVVLSSAAVVAPSATTKPEPPPTPVSKPVLKSRSEAPLSADRVRELMASGAFSRRA